MPNNNHPHIQALHELYQEETQAFRKVHRMIDLFETIIKTYTVVILSEYIKQNKLSDSAKGLLSQGLRTPSLGTWQLFSRVLFEELQKDNYTWLVGEFPKEFLSLDKALNNEKTNVIALRNGYAHGATPTDVQCEEDIKKFEPFLTQLIASKWLGASSLEVRDNKVNLVASEGEISLHPILLYRNEESAVSFAFFNDIKNDKIGLLNYPLSKHYREKDFYTEFHEHLPLNEWKKSGNNEFYQRIEELTETFKGRTAEREQLLRFVEDKSKGYFSIQGNPGIGKSALIAQFFKDLRVNDKLKHIQVVEYFIRRGTAQANTDYLLNYLIKRTDELFPQGREIRAEDKNTWSLQQQLFSKWRLWAEHSKGNKLLFLIDGLDEGVEDDIIKYLPRENFENVLIIYGSRPGGHRSIDELWSTLPTEYHTKLELSGLSKQDIRALIYEVANKYALERESAWIDAVEKRSQGNPLYLKLLCDALENGSIALNDIKAIPEEIDQFYKEIIGRYAKDTLDGDALLAGLYTFAAAKDYLTMAHLGFVNKLGEAQVERVGSTLKEVLYENPLTEDVFDYQLFHESFREYLVKEKNKQVLEAAERIIDFCATWQDLEGTVEQRYTLENYAPHLSESKKELRHKELLALFQNDVYTTTQKKVLKQFDATKKLYQLALLKAGEVKENDVQLEAALCLVDLKYEEANDAPQIVALVANNEIDLALKRIESFGGNDKEGLQRKFILYMLCLMELTLLESKNKSFSKTAIEKILKHFDEKMPIDHSILNWNDFFPSYLMFQMACEYSEMGFDFLIVYKRTDKWENQWIDEKGLYSDTQLKVLIECTRGILDDSEKSNVLHTISNKLVKQGKIDEAMECTKDIIYEKQKSNAFSKISTELTKQGNLEAANSFMQKALESAQKLRDKSDKSEAFSVIVTELIIQGEIAKAYECAKDIIDEKQKSNTFSKISTELTKQGNLEAANSFMQKALESAQKLRDKSDKSEAFSVIVTKLIIQGEIVKAYECAKDIIHEKQKSNAFSKISTELTKQGNLEAANSFIQKAIESAQKLRNKSDKSEAFSVIAKELSKQGKIQESIKYARRIPFNSVKVETFFELLKNGNILVIPNAIECARGLSDKLKKNEALLDISTEMVKQDRFEESARLIKECLEYAYEIDDDSSKSLVIMYISDELLKQGKQAESLSILAESLECTFGIRNQLSKLHILESFSIDLAKDGRIKQALQCAREINSLSTTNRAFLEIAIELLKQDEHKVASVIQETLECPRGIIDYYWKSNLITDIASKLAKKGIVDESLECFKHIKFESGKIRPITIIGTQQAKLGQIEEAFEGTKHLKFERDKISMLLDIASELEKNGLLEGFKSAINQAVEYISKISAYISKSEEFLRISRRLAKHQRMEEAYLLIKESIRCAYRINDILDKCLALSFIATELTEQGQIEEASSLMHKTLEFASEINDDYWKSITLSVISTQFYKQGKLEEASSEMKLAHEYAFDQFFEDSKCYLLKDISYELVKQNKFAEAALFINEALNLSSAISEESDKSLFLQGVATELTKLGHFTNAEKAGLEITQIGERQTCWKEIATNILKILGWLKSLHQVSKFQSEEARLFYLKGWTEAVNLDEMDTICLQEALKYLVYDSESIETLLQKHAINQLFFGDASKEQINRLNKTLNIQWAIDIKAQFPSKEEIQRLSTNIEEWLNEIADERDRDDIELWALQVVQGKWTEEKFQERLKEKL